MGEAVFNQLMRFMNQLIIAAENFAREENLSQVLIPTIVVRVWADQVGGGGGKGKGDGDPMY